MLEKCKTDKEFRLCGYGPRIWGDNSLNIRLRIDLPALRFGIFWFDQHKIELGFEDLGGIITAIGEYANLKFCNKCGQYYQALLTQEIKEENFGNLTVCHICRPDLFEVEKEDVREEFHFLIRYKNQK